MIPKDQHFFFLVAGCKKSNKVMAPGSTSTDTIVAGNCSNSSNKEHPAIPAQSLLLFQKEEWKRALS
jgi:hypothetical protein